MELRTIELAPAGRADFIVAGPAAGQVVHFQQAGFGTGPIGPLNPAQELANILAMASAEEPPALGGGASPPEQGQARLAYVLRDAGGVTARRKLYFAEAAGGTNGPTRFFVTVEGHPPNIFARISILAFGFDRFYIHHQLLCHTH